MTIVVLVVTLLIGGSVSKKMDDSLKVAKQIGTLSSTVPSEAQAKEELQYIEKFAQDADQVDLLMAKASQRELICYDPVILPEPTEKSTQVYNVFGRNYRKAIESLLTRINAKDAPSDAEIRSQTGVGTGGGTMTGMMPMNPTPGAAGASSAMVDAVCLKRADEIPVYANPSIFNWYGYWENFVYKSVDESLQNCWSSQIAYWVYEDVVQSIETINSGSSRVSESPVKRLLGVQFNGPVQVFSSQSMGFGMGGMEPMGMMPGYTGGPAMLDAPVYVKTVSPFMQIPWTGRMCNDQIDVIHFAVSVITDSSATTLFMKELCSAKPHTYREGFLDKGKQETASHNQITVMEYEIEPIIKTDAVHAYYRYGNSAVVRLNLVCEYVFSRKGYDAIKPAPVKKSLGQDAGTGQTGTGTTDPGAGGAPGTPGGIMM
ncbi:MAG: hypothetical protein ABFD91_11540 [Anaerohalosphaeraceae bacterium]